MLEIARHFFNFDRWLGAHPIGSGNINDTYRIDFERAGKLETFVLQRLNHQVFKNPEAVMTNIAKVTAWLENSDFPYLCPAPIPTLEGSLYFLMDGNYWRVFPFLANTVTPEGNADPSTAYQAARAYGAFAHALCEFPASNLAETIPGFHDTDMRWTVFLQTLERDPVGRVGDCEAEISRMFRAKPVFDEISRLKKSGALPLRVTHNDTKAGNILFDSQSLQAVAVIDLDTVMPGVILSDFGDMVRTFVPTSREDSAEPVQLRLDMLQSLTDGFLEQTGGFLTEIEKENLLLGGAWITGEQALRFLSDWLAGDMYYKIQYPEHNLVRAKNQLDLFEALLVVS
ncbi:MAG: aminoglycoside phosphotransferase family protein [Saprospiraceae bacterium]|nr:aminoglycoside phosphotransferase family protein [Saprospiraceae bacterium]